MRQMCLVAGKDANELMLKYNEKAEELGEAIVGEASIGDNAIRIYYETTKISKLRGLGSTKPEEICGTCSTCPHFESARQGGGRGQYVCWGYCKKHDANINEHHKWCSVYRQEVESREEVKVDYRETQEIRRVYAV